jgi:hypothetical protein
VGRVNAFSIEVRYQAKDQSMLSAASLHETLNPSTSGTAAATSSTIAAATNNTTALHNLSAGAKAGIGVGVGLGAILLLIALGALIVFRRKKESAQGGKSETKDAEDPVIEKQTPSQIGAHYDYYKPELEDTSNRITSIGGGSQSWINADAVAIR